MCGLERWRDVVGWEGLYQVSDLGRVRSVDRVTTHTRNGTIVQVKRKGKILQIKTCGQLGYAGVSLCEKGICRTTIVHRIVAEAWIGPCPDGCEIRHGPNGITDNSVDNLSYGTRSQNEFDKRRDGTGHIRSVIRSDDVVFISISVAAEETDCNYHHIWKCCKGYRKTAGGYGWSYYDD